VDDRVRMLLVDDHLDELGVREPAVHHVGEVVSQAHEHLGGPLGLGGEVRDSHKEVVADTLLHHVLWEEHGHGLGPLTGELEGGDAFDLLPDIVVEPLEVLLLHVGQEHDFDHGHVLILLPAVKGLFYQPLCYTKALDFVKHFC